jgi:hypothetical protein
MWQILIIFTITTVILVRFLLFRKQQSKQILIVLGSGGHTGEILQLIKNFDFTPFSKTHFVIAATDTTSKNSLK